MQKKQAFTLIELMVTVAIIAILATLGVSSYSAAIRKARDAKQKSDIQTITQALILYRSDEKTYPAAGDLDTLETDGYLQTIPTSGRDGVIYTYTPVCSGSGSNVKCATFTMCTGALENPKGSANSTSATSLTNCTNTNNSVASGACKYFCMTNP